MYLASKPNKLDRRSGVVLLSYVSKLVARGALCSYLATFSDVSRLQSCSTSFSVSSNDIMEVGTTRSIFSAPWFNDVLMLYELRVISPTFYTFDV